MSLPCGTHIAPVQAGIPGMSDIVRREKTNGVGSLAYPVALTQRTAVLTHTQLSRAEAYSSGNTEAARAGAIDFPTEQRLLLRHVWLTREDIPVVPQCAA